MTSLSSRLLQQVAALQVRLTELSIQGRLDLLTDGEVALISYALGRYHGELLQQAQAPRPAPPTPRPERNKAKGKAGK
jgi:hypothetical protein